MSLGLDRSRRVLYGGVVFVLCVSWACGGSVNPTFDKIILISIDTLRADYLGVYGAPAGLTPATDELAESSMVFEDAITSATSTLPSHTSLFYSQHTFIHNAYTGNPPDPQLVSPVEVIRRAGYRTAAFVGGGQLRPIFRLNRGFDTYEIINTRNINPTTRNTDRLANLQAAANGFLDEHGDESFFLFLHTYEPHQPYDAPDRFMEEVRAIGVGGGDVALDAPLVEFQEGLGVPKEAWVASDRRLQYAAEVRYVDDFIGKLLDRLRELELTDEVVVIFLADHGESLGERGLLGHNRFTTEQLRVPLMIRVPGVEGSRASDPVQLLDVMPTIFSLFGLEQPYPFLGADLRPLLAGEVPTWSADRIRVSENKGVAAVLQGPWKAVFNIEPVVHTSVQLFNLVEDPGELVDRSEDRPELALQLVDEYERLLIRHAGLKALFPRAADGPPELDEETLRDLRTLGYIR